MFAQIDFSMDSIAIYVYKYSSFMLNQYYRLKVYEMLYKCDAHVMLVTNKRNAYLHVLKEAFEGKQLKQD